MTDPVPAAAHLSNTPLLALYREMRRIRSFEERVGELFLRGESAGSMLHLSIGEEGIVGVCRAMNDGDSFTTHHRGHGIFLARGAEPGRMMAEIAGKETGYCQGKGGSMHIADMSLGHLGANAIVGGGIPHVVGAALGYRNKQQPQVAVAFFGDGAMQQGILYESMNMAALWKLPVVFCCINNQYGMGTRIDRATSTVEFDQRAQAFGLNAVMLDGVDVENVHRVATDVFDAARRGEPGFISMDCYRFHGHARMDKSPYRTEQEEQVGRKRDPLIAARHQLVDKAITTDEQLDALDAEILQEMDAALDYAVASRSPAHDSKFQHVYSDRSPPPCPVRTRLARVLSERRS